MSYRLGKRERAQAKRRAALNMLQDLRAKAVPEDTTPRAMALFNMNKGLGKAKARHRTGRPQWGYSKVYSKPSKVRSGPL